MKDFNSIIREKYSQEVNPAYSQEAWEQFASMAGISTKKKRRFIWWWLIGALIIISGSAFYMFKEGHGTQSIASYQESNVSETEFFGGKEIKKKEIEDNSIKNEGNSNDNNGFNSTSLLVPSTKSNSTIIEELESFNAEQNNNIPAKEVKKPQLNGEIDDHPGDQSLSDIILTSITSQSKIRLDKENLDLRKENFVPSLNKSQAQLSNLFFLHKFKTKENITKVYAETSPRLSFQAMIGSGVTYHRSIHKERQYNLQFNVNYYVHERINLIASGGLFNQSFESRVLYHNLGLRSSSYQPRSVSLDKVSSSGNNVEFSLGIEWLPIQYRRLSLSIENSMAHITRLNQDLVYDFKNGESYFQESNSTDVIRSLPNWAARLGTGIKYSLSDNIDLLTKVYFQKPIFGNELQYPTQLRWMLGVEKKW